MKKAVKVQPDGKWEIIEFDNDTSLDVLQKAVDGFIEAVTVKPNHFVMWVNEEYLYRPDFTQNILGTALYEQATGAEHPVFGTIVVTGDGDSEGETKGLDEAHLNLIVKMATFHEQAIDKITD